MTIFGQIGSGMSEPEKLVGIWAVLVLLGLVVWRSVKWFLETKPAPDPWDETVAAAIEKEDAVPLCHHCLCPHSEDTDFCPECGTPVGKYTNWLPFPQLFSVGHVLRIGTFGSFKRSPLTVAGFWIFGLAEYAIFAPVYWFMLFRNKLQPGKHTPPNRSPEETSPNN